VISPSTRGCSGQGRPHGVDDGVVGRSRREPEQLEADDDEIIAPRSVPVECLATLVETPAVELDGDLCYRVAEVDPVSPVTEPHPVLTRGLGKDHPALVEQADKTFEDATATITPAARSLIARLRAIDDPPDEVGIEFGVELSAQTGAFIASVAGRANFTVSMTWRRRGSGAD